MPCPRSIRAASRNCRQKKFSRWTEVAWFSVCKCLANIFVFPSCLVSSGNTHAKILLSAECLLANACQIFCFLVLSISIQFKPTLIPLKFSLGCRGFGRHFDPDGSSVFLSSTVRTGARSRPRKWKWCAFQGHVPRACHKKEPRTGGGRPTKLTCKPFHGCVTEGNERNVVRNIVCCTLPQSAFLVKQKCSARGRTSERLGANPGEAVARSNCRGKSAGRLRRPISVDSRNRAMAPRFVEMEYPFDEVTSVSR